MVDREAFGRIDEQVYILKTFWNSPECKLVIARKADTQSIVGYACFQEDAKAAKNGGYLMRIGVRSKCQRQGVGRKLMDYLFNKFPGHLSLDVSTDNVKAVNFYKRVGLVVTDTYLSEEKVEFNKFETPEGFVHTPLTPQIITGSNATAAAATSEELKGDDQCCGSHFSKDEGSSVATEDAETVVSDDGEETLTAASSTEKPQDDVAIATK